MTPLVRHLVEAMDLTGELAATLDETGLGSRIELARSNTIGSQLWCVVGARESYARAIEAGRWTGFSCSLDQPHSPSAVCTSLADSRRRLLELLERHDPSAETVENNLLELLEHETQHHGQLIRYFYANDLPFSTGFANRYALS